MAAEMRAIELEGTVDEAGRLSVDEPLRAVRPGRVRLIVLAPGSASATDSAPDDLDERVWLRAAAASPSFAFLADPAEDVYSPQDGKPFIDASTEVGPSSL
jgi:hypothetical protein